VTADGKIRHARCEVDIVEHCNLACRSCSHLSPVLPRREASAEEVHRDLSRLWRHYEAGWVALLGGEPLLHRDLIEVIRAAKDATSARVSVVTNGLLLPRMPAAFWEAVDGVQVCLYPGKELAPAEVRDCRRRAREHAVPMVVTRVDRFRESYSETGTGDAALVERIYAACTLRHGHTIAAGHFYKCPPGYFLPKVLAGLEPGGGVRLDDGGDLGDRLRAHLGDPEPLAACGNCLGVSGRVFRQAQAPRAEFRALQQRTTEELLDPRRLKPPSRVRQRLTLLRPQYYLHERRLM
jgi:Radical SAM superfamily